ncbi:activating signal cointegrator 1 complex subunit 1 isoform X2 [Cryptosporidium felis]|nr:activating signal cointegrator 1 complex subunit 1 isoform X2 [Cryptosporidium felis]
MMSDFDCEVGTGGEVARDHLNETGPASSGKFFSKELERLEEKVLFPPIGMREIHTRAFSNLKNGAEGRMVVEYIDLKQIPACILNKFAKMKPTREMEVSRESNSSSESGSEESENEATIGVEVDNLGFIGTLKEGENEIRINRRPTHFFSLTFNKHSENLAKEFRALKRNVLESAEYTNIKSSYFIGEQKLHITLGLVRLETEEDLTICKGVLDKLRDTQEFKDISALSSSKKGMPVGLQGLGCFGSPQNSRVVFAKLREHHKITLIKHLSFKLSEILVDSGISITVSELNSEALDYSHNVIEKLKQDFNPHVTFINTKYGSKKEKERAFDSSKLLKSYSKKSFGSGFISEIQLNELSGNQEIETAGRKEQVYNTISSIEFRISENNNI